MNFHRTLNWAAGTLAALAFLLLCAQLDGPDEVAAAQASADVLTEAKAMAKAEQAEALRVALLAQQR